MRETRATQSHLITSVARARLKQDLKCWPSFRRAGTGVGLANLGNDMPLVCSYKAQHEICSCPTYAQDRGRLVLFVKPGPARSKLSSWQPVPPARLSPSMHPSASCCRADPINARAIASPASETGVG